MPVLSEGDRYYPSTKIDENEEYYLILDSLIHILLKEKIKRIDAGFDYHYMTFKGNITVKRKKWYNQEHLLVKDGTSEFEMTPMNWESIIIRDNGIVEIEMDSGGIYIEFNEKVNI